MMLTHAERAVTLTLLPSMQLLEPATGQLVSLGQLADGAQALLVMWWCNHCPFVKHLKSARCGREHEACTSLLNAKAATKPNPCTC